MEWSQISVGAIPGGAATWVAGVARSLIDVRIQEWTKDKDEARRLKAEGRDEQKRIAARLQDATVTLAKNENVLLSFKTMIRGSTDLLTAAHHLHRVHDFFRANPQYIAVATNRQFLETWTYELYGELSVDPNQIHYRNRSERLAKLMTDLEALRLSDVNAKEG